MWRIFCIQNDILNCKTAVQLFDPTLFVCFLFCLSSLNFISFFFSIIVPPLQLQFQGNVSIDKSWNPELADKSTLAYQEKADNVSKMVSVAAVDCGFGFAYINGVLLHFQQYFNYIVAFSLESH
jgi:hypothetical protein